MKPFLRPASPTDDDAGAFADLADQAAHGEFRKVFGSSAPKFLSAVFREPDHDLSYENVTFAEVGDVIVGMVAAYSAEAHRARAPNTRRVVARRIGLGLPRVLFVYLIGRHVFGFTDHLEPADHYVQMLAVAPDHRERGIGTRLLAAAEDAASEARRMVLDVGVDNHAAIALYEALGWEIIAASPRASRWLDHTQVYRLAKERTSGPSPASAS